MSNSAPIPIVAPDLDVTQFIQRALYRWISSEPAEKIRARFASASHVDSLATGLEKRGIDAGEFKGRLWARMLGQPWKPDPKSTPAPSERATTGSTLKLILKGKEISFKSNIDMLHELLKALAGKDDTFLERLYNSGLVSGRTRKLIAQTPEDLYDNPKVRDQYVRRLPGGWLLGTNLDSVRIHDYIKIISGFAGLEFGKDIVVKLEDQGIKDPLS